MHIPSFPQRCNTSRNLEDNIQSTLRVNAHCKTRSKCKRNTTNMQRKSSESDYTQANIKHERAMEHLPNEH